MQENLDQTISNYFFDNAWHLTLNFCIQYWEVLVDILLYHMGPDKADIDLATFSLGFSHGKVFLFTYSEKISKSMLRHLDLESILPRKSITVWRAIHDKLRTWDNLHFKGPSVCPLCFKEEENVDHLFIFCEFAQQLWQRILSAFNISIKFPTSFGISVLLL